MKIETNLPAFAVNCENLASAKAGAEAIDCSDDFFADKSRLLSDSEPEFYKGWFDDHGQYMDGWESRRRRTTGNDWCLIRLAKPGRIVGFDINTAHFTGNYPPGASIDGSSSEDVPSDDDWQELLEPVSLTGDNQHFFESQFHEKPIRWVRLNIYPDGGVARLKVYGEPDDGLGNEDQNTQPSDELSALRFGGRVVTYSNAHYGNPEFILTPGRGKNMGDGWETARRRVPGNEWIIIRLGRIGTIERLEIDTAHFKGNYPSGCSLQAALSPHLQEEALVAQAMFWDEVLNYRELTADSIHTFDLKKLGAVSHVKLNIYPDGGVSRVRVFGEAK